MKDAMKKARKNAGLTFDELSALSGVAVSTLSNWENGHSHPMVGSAALVADALEISIDAYVGRKNKMYTEFLLMRKFLRNYELLEDYEDFKKEETEWK